MHNVNFFANDERAKAKKEGAQIIVDVIEKYFAEHQEELIKVTEEAGISPEKTPEFLEEYKKQREAEEVNRYLQAAKEMEKQYKL